MDFRIADGHVHLEDVVIGEFDSPRIMLDSLADKGVTDVSLLAYMPFSDIVTNLRVLYWKKNYRRMSVRAFGCFHEADIYRDIPYETQYENLMKLGCDGVKFIQMKPDRRKALGKGLNDASYDRVLSIMEERGTPALIHSGDPETFWNRDLMTEDEIRYGWFYGDGTHLSCDEIYEECFEMLKKHPKLRVTFAHFFFLSNKIEEARRVMETYENVNFDLTPGWEMYLGFSKDIDAWHDFFEKYSDRIMFGTDSNDGKTINGDLVDLVRMAITHDRSEFPMPVWNHMIRGLALSDDTVRKICRGNYIRFAGETPRPVNDVYMLETAERMLSDIPTEPEMAPSAAWLREMILNRKA